MKLQNRSIGVPVAVCLLVACAAGPDVSYVKDADTRIQRNGFSLLPPSGKGWLTAPAGQYGAGWGKLLSDSKGDRSTITLMVYAGQSRERKEDLSTPQGLKDAVVYAVTGADPNRYHVVAAKYSGVYQMQGTDCIDFESTVEDSANQMSWNKGVVLVVDSRGKFCRHPSNSNWSFSVIFSDRHPKESASLMDDTVQGEARRCIDSVLLTPLS